MSGKITQRRLRGSQGRGTVLPIIMVLHGYYMNVCIPLVRKTG
jgi:hypothetical protein